MSTPEFKTTSVRDYLVHAEEDELDPFTRLHQNSTYDSGQYRKISQALKAQVHLLGFFIRVYLSCSMSVG